MPRVNPQTGPTDTRSWDDNRIDQLPLATAPATREDTSMLRNFFAREEGQDLFGLEAGQGLVEYALIIALVSIALVLALGAMSGALQNVFGRINQALANATS